MDFIELWTICSANGIVLDKHQIDLLERFSNELIYWNNKVNLISRKDEVNLLEHHIIHSLSILKYLKIPNKSKCLDVGTGGGLPGIPLAIACPDSSFLLVDSIAKKMKITSMMAKHTELKKLKTVCSRVENLADNTNFINHFDYIITRAVASIETIVNWTNKLAKPSCKFIFLKGGDLVKELEQAKKSYPDLIINEKDIIFNSFDWFRKENKKIIIAQKRL